ncbi:MAG: ASCH domain-containing protein [Candidatus Berkelbacteria bacterium]|nr:ASCH domain-containing protein [Candidatus Berkelbacteria bacterium]
MDKIITMKLLAGPFEAILTDQKSVEVRLNDEKRREIKVGDLIQFSLEPELKQSVTVKVTELLQYHTFYELHDACGADCFRNKTKEEFESIIFSIYSKEQESRYGVLGIRFIKL